MVVIKRSFFPFAIVTINLLLAVFFENRSFVLGNLAAIIFLYLVYRSKRVSPICFFGGGLVFLLLSFFLAFVVKRDSTEGRLLIYKVSTDMFRDHYLLGIGQGNFKKNYLHYQAAYFERGDYSEQELLLADNTYYAFNDYWQFVIEWGIFGGFVLLTVSFFIGYMIYRVLCSPERRSVVFLTACILLIPIVLAAFFNHVSERLYIQLIFFLSISIIGWFFSKRYIRSKIVYFVFVSLGMIVPLLGQYGHKIIAREAYHQWRESESLRRMGYFNEALRGFETAYPYLYKDPSFLRGYAEIMMSARRFKEAISIFEEAIPHWVGHRMYINLGLCYHQDGRNTEAEQIFLKSIYMVPNRFESRFALFNFYLETGRKTEAVHFGKIILELPVKVPSARVEAIKKDVQRSLSELK